MTERVPANPAKPRANSRWQQDSALDCPRPSRSSRCIRTRKEPVRIPRLWCCLFFVIQQESCKFRMHWQAPVGIFCLHIINVADHKTPLNVNLTVSPVKIAPLQSDEFTGAESEARRNNAHGADRFFQVMQEKPKLVRCKNLRLPHS